MKRLVILAFVCVALASSQAHAQGIPLRLKTAAVLVDSADNVIGPVFDAQVVDKGDLFVQPEVTFAHVLLESEGVSFFLRANRSGFINATSVFFDMPDCFGNAWLLATFAPNSLLLPGVIFRDAVYVPDRAEQESIFFASLQTGPTQCSNSTGGSITAVTATKLPFDTSQFTPAFRMIRK